MLVSRATAGLAEDLSAAILDNEDPQIVESGAPAYLIMLDALLNSDPDNPDLLAAAATLNAAYASAFVTEPDRQSRLADKALAMSMRSACLQLTWTCGVRDLPFADLEAHLVEAGPRDVGALYALSSGWAGWIQIHRDDWSAIAQLAAVKAIMIRVSELDERYDHGSPHMYLGVFETLLPPAMGGKPELGREHFERAIELNGGEYLMAKVLFAENYTRLMFERELHDTLLTEVVEADPAVEGLTLINLIAQAQARALLESADDYF